MVETAVAVQEDRTGEPDQLELRFFAVVDGFARRQPERALWRVLIDTALAKTDVFMARGRRISAEAVHHVALAFYMQAEECRMSDRNVRTARHVLNDLRGFRVFLPVLVMGLAARFRLPRGERGGSGGSRRLLHS